MLSIQEVGTEILTNKPRSLYFFVGDEFGVKDEYVRILTSYYGDVKNVETVASVYALMSHKRIVPLPPALYVCRYDESFISTLDGDKAAKLLNCKMIGTLVCIYDGAKHATKLDKFFPNNVVSIDPIAADIQLKYLQGHCPSVPEHILKLIVNITSSYGHALVLSSNLENAQCYDLYQHTDAELIQSFGYSSQSQEKTIKRGIASRNFKYILDMLDAVDDYNTFLYHMLSTFVELDKLIYSPRAASDLSDFVKRWSAADIYAMFSNTYRELLRSRSETVDLKSRIVYLLSLMQFNPIPNMEVTDV